MKAVRGEYKKEIARKNRGRIRAWLEKNPGFSYVTIRKHIDAIKQE